MHFEVRSATQDRAEHAVFAVSPRYGNDAALLAVFDHRGAADELALILNFAAQHQRAFAPGSPV
jgi:hypothetical protein